MHRTIFILAFVTVLAGVGAVRTVAQAPPARPTPGVPAIGASINELAGTVTMIDPVAQRIEISEPSNRAGRTVEVTLATKIRIEGRHGRLRDIREGARVSVSYEVREGRDIAMSIDVVSVQGTKRDPVTPPTAPSGLVVK